MLYAMSCSVVGREESEQQSIVLWMQVNSLVWRMEGKR